MNPTASTDRPFFIAAFRRILTGWHRILLATSPSAALWDPPAGIRNDNFLSISGKQCDGVTRLLPALAAWVCQPENPDQLTLDDGTTIQPLAILKNALTNATDPTHPDFWQFAPANQQNQRQVEASIVAWSLWLARHRLLPLLAKQHIANLQNWLASCTQFTDLFSNWSLFVATNHAARIALSDAREGAPGFHGDPEIIRRSLIVGDEAYSGDGWLWDTKWSGLDYYNFWVNTSHHFYIHAMLPNFQNPLLARALERSCQRLADLPYLLDSAGQNILFGRSLAYRWGWLSGLVAAIFTGHNPIPPGLARSMLARNLQRYFDTGSFNDQGLLRERLTPHGSDGSRQSYINAGHPYWGMQAFLCLALPASHPFWAAPPQPLPVEQADFQLPRQGPGFIFQGIHKTGEVRLFNTRNLNHAGKALYEKFVYASAFPCNALPGEATCWDNQFALRLADGAHVGPSEVLLVDTNDPAGIRITWRFRHAPDFIATINTLITLDTHAYITHHTVHITGTIPPGAQWIEGGFPLGHDLNQPLTTHHIPTSASAHTADKSISTHLLTGWQTLHDLAAAKSLYPSNENPNIFHETADHFLLTTPVTPTPTTLSARHSATLTAPTT